MEQGECAYCLNHGMLCKSHAIPHAIFKRIHRKNNGQALPLDKTDAMPRKSNESGASYLLCDSCEADLNERFDKYGYNWLNEVRNQLSSEKNTKRSFDVGAIQMAGFITSVLWRCSVSSSKIYRGVKFNESTEGMLKSCILNTVNPLEKMSFSITDIYDGNGHFKDESIHDWIMTPLTFDTGPNRSGSVCMFLIFGFIVAVHLPRLKYQFNSQPNFLKKNRDKIFITRNDFRKAPLYKKFLELAPYNTFSEPLNDV